MWAVISGGIDRRSWADRFNEQQDRSPAQHHVSKDDGVLHELSVLARQLSLGHQSRSMNQI
jgi:hypothetical protein